MKSLKHLLDSLKKKMKDGSNSTRITTTKNKIKSLLKELQEENSNHTRYFKEFQTTGDECDVDGVNCSKCGNDAVEDERDLYFCDAEGCCRAYHLDCLDPPMSAKHISTDPNEDWFCRQCRCVADCLVMINERCGTMFSRAEDVFSEAEENTISSGKDSKGGTLKTIKNSTKRSSKKDPQEDKVAPPQKSKARDMKNSSGTNVDKSLSDVTETAVAGNVTCKTSSDASYFTYPDSVTLTSWGKHYKNINRLLLSIEKCKHYVDVYCTQSKSDSVVIVDNLERAVSDIRKHKLAVRETLKEIVEANNGHTRYEVLDNDEDSIDIMEVDCSVCGKPDSETEDILLCDRKGCCRAYHPGCLNPPLSQDDVNSDPDVDWFCWSCRCLADCLALINEFSDTNYEDSIEEVFAEAVADEEDKGEGVLAEPWGDSESEDDGDYVPREERLAGDSDGSEDGKDGSGEDDGPAPNDSEEDATEYPVEDHNATEEIVGSESDSSSESALDDDAEDDLESDISGEELQGLIDEAGDDIEVECFSRRDETVDEIVCQPEETGLISSRLRRKVNKPSEWSLPAEFPPINTLCPADVYVGFPVAKVKAGRVIIGSVVCLPGDSYSSSSVDEVKESFVTSSSSREWRVEYVDQSSACLKWDTLREKYECRVDYEKQLRKFQETEVAATGPIIESIEEGNIITGKRKKKILDYQQLNREMFGHLKEESDDEEFSDKPISEKPKRKRKKRKQLDELAQHESSDRASEENESHGTDGASQILASDSVA